MGSITPSSPFRTPAAYSRKRDRRATRWKEIQVRSRKSTCATLVYSGSPLNAPVASALLPNGNLIVANTKGGNKLVELTPAGKILDAKTIDTIPPVISSDFLRRHHRRQYGAVLYRYQNKYAARTRAIGPSGTRGRNGRAIRWAGNMAIKGRREPALSFAQPSLAAEGRPRYVRRMTPGAHR